MRHLFLCLALVTTIDIGMACASEFRAFRAIATPKQMIAKQQGLQRQAVITPVSQKGVEKAVTQLIKAWNANTIDRVLGDEFFDKSRLSDAMNGSVPRDAKLSVLAIQDTQTLQQQVMDSPSGKLLVSVVSITLKTQLTFNDPLTGYQRREGVNEYIVRIKQRAF